MQFFLFSVVSSTSTFLIDISLSSAVVGPGSSVQIHCIVNSTQAGTTIKWFGGNGNGEIVPSGSKYQLFDNGTLQISDFGEHDEGQYYCSATNSLGSVMSLPTSSIEVACKAMHEYVLHLYMRYIIIYMNTGTGNSLKKYYFLFSFTSHQYCCINVGD